MFQCIYCDKIKLPDETWADEHIVPRSLGNNHLVIKNAVCNTCN